MAKFDCKCGNVITTSGQIPNPDEWLMMSDVEFDTLDSNIDSEELYKKMVSLFVCNRCKRIWIFWKGFKSEPTPYINEE